jgi:hypothetical protein
MNVIPGSCRSEKPVRAPVALEVPRPRRRRGDRLAWAAAVLALATCLGWDAWAPRLLQAMNSAAPLAAAERSGALPANAARRPVRGTAD